MRQGKFIRALDNETETRFQKVEEILSNQSKQMESIAQMLTEKQAKTAAQGHVAAGQNQSHRKCYNCGKPLGHFSRQCPEPKKHKMKSGKWKSAFHKAHGGAGPSSGSAIPKGPPTQGNPTIDTRVVTLPSMGSEPKQGLYVNGKIKITELQIFDLTLDPQTQL